MPAFLNNKNLRSAIYLVFELLFAILLVVAIVQAFVSGDVDPVDKLLNLAALLGFDLARRYVPEATDE